MLMEHAGLDHVLGTQAQQNWKDALPDHRLVAAALLDLLSEHVDRHAGNLMLNGVGSLRLLDPDKSFGQSRGAGLRSVFFPGGLYAYRTPQQSFEELAPEAQELVDALAHADAATVAEIYQLNANEAAILIQRAQQVRSMGLSKAIAQYLATTSLQ
jgi:hypothetical protein